MAVINILLPLDIEEQLDNFIRLSGKSKNQLINQAVKEFLERDMLGYQRWQETQEALVSANQGRVIDGDTVHQWLRQWGAEDIT